MIRHFEEDLEYGVKVEEELKPLLKKLILIQHIERLSFEKNPELQRKGIDIIAKFKDESKIDIKTRKFWDKREDVLIELEHSYGKKGWYYTSEADVIAYVWRNSKDNNFVDGYLLMLQDSKFRKWFEENLKLGIFKIPKHAKSINQNRVEWNTKNAVVPISKFPEGTLFRFNPKLKKEDKQMDFSQFTKTEVNK